jgi:hypothetical protein
MSTAAGCTIPASTTTIASGASSGVIIGKREGEDTTEAQAYRYPVKDWTAGAARRHCKKAGGEFHPAGEVNETEVNMSDQQVLVECPKGHEEHGRGSAGWPGGRAAWEKYHKGWIKKETTPGLLSYHRRLHMIAANMDVELT